jgi:hypothetical protein
MPELIVEQTKYVTLVTFTVSMEKNLRDRADYHLGKYLFTEIVPWLESQGFQYKETATARGMDSDAVITRFEDANGGSVKIGWGSYYNININFHECLETAMLFKLTFKV